MTAPLRRPDPDKHQALDRVRRGDPLVVSSTASDEKSVALRAWGRQVVAVALALEGVDLSTLHTPED